jgi:hypothetical protein
VDVCWSTASGDEAFDEEVDADVDEVDSDDDADCAD